MYTVSAAFKAIANRQTIPPYKLRMLVNGVVTPVVEMSFKDIRDTLIGSFSAKTITVKFDKNAYSSSFRGATLQPYLSFAELAEELPIGIFYVDDEDITYDEVKSLYTVVAYDAAIKFDQPIDDLDFACDEGWELFNRIGDKVGVYNGESCPESIYPSYIQGANINAGDNVTYRQVIKALTQMSMTSAHIDRLGNMRYSEFFDRYHPVYTPVVDARSYFNLKIDKEYRPINSILYDRVNIQDPIVLSVESNVAANGLNQIKFYDNFIMDFHDRNRQIHYISSFIEYYQDDVVCHWFSVEDGIVFPWFDAGDLIAIKDIDGNLYPTRIQNIEWTWNGALRGKMSCEPFNELKEDPVVTAAEKKIQDLGVKVDRVNENITTLVSTTSDLNTKYSEIKSTAELITSTVSNIKVGGRNLVYGSDERVSNANDKIRTYYLTETIPEGTEMTVSIKGQLGTGKTSWFMYNSGGFTPITAILATDRGADGVYRKTFKWVVGSEPNTSLTLHPSPSHISATSTIDWIKLERGNVATDFTVAPEEIANSVLSQATQYIQSSTGFDFIIQQEMNEDNAGKLDNIGKHITFDADGITITGAESIEGQTTPQYSTLIDDNSIDFRKGGTVLGSFADTGLTTDTVITNSITISKFAWVDDGSGGLILRKEK